MKSLPKGLVFDGKTNWFAFKHKFMLYANKLGWTTDDCYNCLCWSLTGKAADFYAVLLEQKLQLNFRQLLSKLESRFGTRELPATAQGRFQQATRDPKETLEDWADRVMALATRAFQDLPEHFLNDQVVNRFCQGLVDKQAGHQVCSRNPKSVEEALNAVRWYQHVQQAMYGDSHRESQVPEYEPITVYNVSGRTTRGVAEAASTSPQGDTLQEDVSYIKKQFERMANNSIAVRSVSESANKRSVGDGSKSDSIESLLKATRVQGEEIHSLAAMFKTFLETQTRADGGQNRSNNQGGGNRPNGGSRNRRPMSDITCFACNKKGHYSRECPEGQDQKQGTKDLNGGGSGGGAKPRPSK